MPLLATSFFSRQISFCILDFALTFFLPLFLFLAPSRALSSGAPLPARRLERDIGARVRRSRKERADGRSGSDGASECRSNDNGGSSGGDLDRTLSFPPRPALLLLASVSGRCPHGALERANSVRAGLGGGKDEGLGPRLRGVAGLSRQRQRRKRRRRRRKRSPALGRPERRGCGLLFLVAERPLVPGNPGPPDSAAPVDARARRERAQVSRHGKGRGVLRRVRLVPLRSEKQELGVDAGDGDVDDGSNRGPPHARVRRRRAPRPSGQAVPRRAAARRVRAGRRGEEGVERRASGV